MFLSNWIFSFNCLQCSLFKKKNDHHYSAFLMVIVLVFVSAHKYLVAKCFSCFYIHTKVSHLFKNPICCHSGDLYQKIAGKCSSLGYFFFKEGFLVIYYFNGDSPIWNQIVYMLCTYAIFPLRFLSSENHGVHWRTPKK